MGEEDKSKGRPILFIVILVVILIALWILIPNIPRALEPEDEETELEIFQKYDEFEGTNVMTYKNQELNVTLNLDYNARRNITGYRAQWVNIWGDRSSAYESSPDDLFDEILTQSVSITTDQIKWFEYIINNILK